MYAKKSRNGSRRHTPFAPFLGHIRCYLCSNLGHMAKKCKLPYTLKNSRQKMKVIASTPNNEGNENNKRKSTKVWKRKKKEKHGTSMTN